MVEREEGAVLREAEGEGVALREGAGEGVALREGVVEREGAGEGVALREGVVEREGDGVADLDPPEEPLLRTPPEDPEPPTLRDPPEEPELPMREPPEPDWPDPPTLLDPPLDPPELPRPPMARCASAGIASMDTPSSRKAHTVRYLRVVMSWPRLGLGQMNRPKRRTFVNNRGPARILTLQEPIPMVERPHFRLPNCWQSLDGSHQRAGRQRGYHALAVGFAHNA